MDPNTRQAKRSPVTLKIKFKSASLEEFIERYAVDVSHGGIFIRTKEPLAVGTTMKFEFQLKDATPLIGGEGTVVWTRENDPARPGVAPGMGVRFDRLAEGSQTVLDRILAQKAKSGATSASTVDPKVFEQPTRAFGANEAPTRVAPSPLATSALAGAPAAAAAGALADRAPRLGNMAPPKSGFQDERTDATPLPNPVPFHSDADEFPEEAFEEATKVRSMEELVAQTAKTDDGVARPSPSAPPADAATAAAAAAATATATSAVDELAARRAAKDPEPEAAPPPKAEAPKAEAKPEPKAEPKAEAKPAAKPEPKPAAKAAAKPVSKPEPRAKAADKPAPAPAKEPAPPPESSSLLPVLVILMLLVGGGAAAYFLWYKKRGEPTEGSGSGSVVQKGTGSASGSAKASGTGSASASGTGTAIASGSGTASGTGTSAMGGAPDAGVVAVEPVKVTIGANVKGAQVEIVGTDMTGTAPYEAKLEPGRTYTARVTAPGYLAAEIDVSDQAPTATATLEAMPAVLHIESTPAGAAIYIESEITGKVTPADITLTAKQAAKPQLRVTLRKANYDKADLVVRKSAFTANGDQLVASTSGSLRAQKKGGGGAGSGTAKGSGSGTASGTASGSGTGTASGTGTSSGSGTGSGSASGSTSGTGSGSGTSSGSGSGTSSGSGSAKPGSGSGTAKPGSGSGTAKPGSGSGGSGSGTGTSSEPTPDWAG